MRATQGSVNRYVASPVPADKDALIDFLRTELLRIEVAMNAIADGQDDLTTVAPAKPRSGMRRYAAAGVLGLTEGFYGYYGGAWNKLG